MISNGDGWLYIAKKVLGGITSKMQEIFIA